MSNKTTSTSQEFLTSLGFLASPFTEFCDNVSQIISICENKNIKSKLDGLDIEFDGLVIKVNNQKHRELLGSTNHHPKRAIAYKYPAKQARTRVIHVERQVGRTGILTPVAELEPVSLSGVTISRVSLHNPDFIQEKQIMIGDYIFLQRSGEVIPYVVCSIPELRSGSERSIGKPDHCPACNDPVSLEIADSGNTSYYCNNISCPAQVKERIKHFVSRDMMNIEGVGDAIVDALVDHQIISSITDIYELENNPNLRMIIKNIPGMGDKKIDLICKGLQQSKSKELYKIIYALGIPQVGEKTAKILCDTIRDYSRNDLLGRPNNEPNNGPNNGPNNRRFNHIDLISFLSDGLFLNSIHSIGPETCNSIIDRIHNTHNREALALLSSYGVDFSNFGSEIIRVSEKLQFIRFAISGTFPLSREQIISELVKQGASYCPNITKNTNLLIIGNNPSSKVSKAEKLGIEIVEGLGEVEKRLDLKLGMSTLGLF